MNPSVEKLASDPERLEVLRAFDILDTPAEALFDDVVAIVSALCEAPIALVSLVDKDRQWFKAKCGIEFDSTALDQSVCAHAIRQDGLLIIPDLTRDDRTKDNALVTGEAGDIRFYAGAPLITSSGVALGSLCVIDVVPRPDGLTDRQQKGLAALGRQTVAMIEMRDVQRSSHRAVAEGNRRTESLQSQRESTISAQEAGRIGTFTLDLETDVLTVSPRFCQIFGVPLQATYPASEIELRVLPADTVKRSNHDGRISGESATETQYRVLLPDGKTRWVERRAKYERDSAGRNVRMLGTVEDITERHDDEERQNVMNRELHHRIKNTLAMVQALAQQTLRRVEDRSAVKALEQRLFALGKAHDLLLKHDWEAASLGDIVGEAVEALGQRSAIDMSGEPVILGPRAAIASAMLIHELATNAMKYGALSVADGRVSLTWRTETAENGSARLVLEWIEQGGPAPTVVPSSTKGFGSRLINLGLIGTGGADLRYLESGLHAVFGAPLELAQAN